MRRYCQKFLKGKVALSCRNRCVSCIILQEKACFGHSKISWRLLKTMKIDHIYIGPDLQLEDFLYCLQQSRTNYTSRWYSETTGYTLTIQWSPYNTIRMFKLKKTVYLFMKSLRCTWDSSKSKHFNIWCWYGKHNNTGCPRPPGGLL